LPRTIGYVNVGDDVVVLGQQSADGAEVAAATPQRVDQQADQGADDSVATVERSTITPPSVANVFHGNAESR